MFENWIYLSKAHRVSKRSGVRQKGYHYVGMPSWKSLNPLDSAGRYYGGNPEVLKVTFWEDTTDTIEVFTEEAKNYNKIIGEMQNSVNNERIKAEQEEYKKRIATIEALRGL